jgi:hypothetical protein
MAIRYGYLWGFAVLVMTVCKEQANTLRPFMAAPDHVAFLKYPLEGVVLVPASGRDHGSLLPQSLLAQRACAVCHSVGDVPVFQSVLS